MEDINVILPMEMIPVATLSNAWVCGHSLPGIAGLNLAGDMEVPLL